jgi:hypothetical protein
MFVREVVSWRRGLTRIFYLLSVMTLTSQEATFAQCPKTDLQARNASTISVALSAYQGWAWADHVVHFCPSTLYDSRRPDNARDQKALLGQLQTAMKDLPKFYVYALTNAPNLSDRSGLMRDQRGELKDSLTAELRTATTDWQQFQAATKHWLTTVQQEYYPNQPSIVISGGSANFPYLFKQYIRSLNQKLASSALYFVDLDDNKFQHNALSRGELLVNIADPIGDWNSSDYQFGLPPDPGHPSSAVITKPEVTGQLQDLEGRLWSKPEILDRLGDLFLRTGFSHTADLSAPNAQPVTVNIGGAAQLRVVQVMTETNNSAEVNRALYMVLPDSVFRSVLQHRGGGLCPLQTVSSPVPYTSLCITSASCGDPIYLRDDELAALTGQLDTAGFKLEIGTYASGASCDVPNDDKLKSIEFRITRRTHLSKESGQRGEKPKAVDSRSSPERTPPPRRGPTKAYSGVLPAQPQVIAGPNPQLPKSVLLPDPSADAQTDTSSVSSIAQKIPEEGKNYVGAGVSYAANQGIRFVGQYERQLENQQVIRLNVGTESAPLGSGSYHKDFLLFDRIHHRLQFDASGGSNYTQNRLFQGIETNERRTGGSAGLTMEWIRHSRGMHLDSGLVGGWSNVTLSNKGSDKSQGLSYVDGNVAFSYASSYVQQTQLNVQPAIRLGVSSVGAEGFYVKPSIGADLLQYITPAWLPDVRIEVTPRFQYASSHTPEFELPSIGGAETVRGFREDASLARSATTLQNELWVPSTGPRRFHGGFGGFLTHNVWIAPFFDYGYSSQTQSGIKGSLMGPGIGARIKYGAALFKLDWGYGIYDGPRDLGGSKFSFNVKTTLPF